MTKVRARFINGTVVFDGPKPDWAEGTELDIAPHRNGAYRDDWDDDRVETPEEIEAWIREFEAIPPLVLTPEEQAKFDEWERTHKKAEIELVAKEFRNGKPGAP
jgi:hypothetical protein